MYLPLLSLIFICSLFSSSGIIGNSLATSPRTITVDKNGNGADYTNIQAAINNAANGDTISVRNGVYTEMVNITKSVNLIGENSQNTVLDGNSYTIGTMIDINANDVNISGFRIARFSQYAVNFQYSGSTVTGCEIDAKAPYRYLSYGTVVAVGFGLTFQTCNNTIINNNITNVGWGFNVGNGSSGNIIDGNYIFMGEDSGVGLSLQYCNTNNVTNNIVEAPYKTAYGLCASSCNQSLFAGNIFTGDYGTGGSPFFLNSCFNNTVIGNTISATGSNGVEILSSSNNTFYHNNFLYGNMTAYLGQNFWDNGYPCGGNYWSRYVGQDNFSGKWQNETGSDGIGDTPYGIMMLIDLYPLMTPSVNVSIPPVPYQTPQPIPTIQPTLTPTPTASSSGSQSSSSSTSHSTSSPIRTSTPTPTPTPIVSPTATPLPLSVNTSTLAPTQNIPDQSTAIIIVIFAILLIGLIVLCVVRFKKPT
jgi:parallel beta-helix repeat protein